ncbi:MAG: deaminase [Betaproteobacteria bacterium]
MPRRRFAIALLLAGLPAARALPAADGLVPDDRRRFAARAMALRDVAIQRGDQPYGAVVVRNGAIVGEGVSAVVTSRDPDAHAERIALRAAAVTVGADDLAGCLLFGSARACTLCEAAAARMRIARMYYGADGADAGAPRSAKL